MAMPFNTMVTIKLRGVAVMDRVLVTVATTLTVSGHRQPMVNIRHCSI